MSLLFYSEYTVTCVGELFPYYLSNPAGNLLWKVEQKSLTAFACAKFSAKGKRHWYKAVEQAAFVALSDDSAWIIRTNGDLFLQTGNYAPVQMALPECHSKLFVFTELQLKHFLFNV